MVGWFDVCWIWSVGDFGVDCGLVGMLGIVVFVEFGGVV